MDAGRREGTVETALLPGWNVLIYESPEELAACVDAFLRRRDWATSAGTQLQQTPWLAGGGTLRNESPCTLALFDRFIVA